MKLFYIILNFKLLESSVYSTENWINSYRLKYACDYSLNNFLILLDIFTNNKILISGLNPACSVRTEFLNVYSSFLQYRSSHKSWKLYSKSMKSQRNVKISFLCYKCIVWHYIKTLRFCLKYTSYRKLVVWCIHTQTLHARNIALR